MTEPRATVSSRRRIPAIWLVPIVAALLGIWMVIYVALTEGPQITIVFSTATGVEAGKTKVKVLDVQVGLVESVSLREDLESVQVVASLDPVARPLLRDDTRFWVVRPRFGAGGISGLGTALSGAYIEIEPGAGEPSRRREFRGLEEPPITAVGTPGLRLTLISARASSVGTGDPILYHGYPVGKVEDTAFDPETQQVRHDIFIDAPYDELVNGATRFWKASGISLEASADGMRLHVASLQTLLSGGVAFGLPEGKKPLGPVASGTEFTLHSSYDSTLEEKYVHRIPYVVSFAQSVRGLVPGAPVDYRGVRVGTVERLMIQEVLEIAERRGGNPIPVLIQIEPGRLALGDTKEAASRMQAQIERDVAIGLRASLQSGNLLTGRLRVSFDFYPDAEPAETGKFAGYTTLPTISGGLQRLEQQASQLLAKLNDLPVEQTLTEMTRTLAALRDVVQSEDFKEIPEQLNASLVELRAALSSFSPDSPLYDELMRTVTELERTLQSLNSLTRSLEAQPSSLIFSKPIEPDPEPQEAP